ncbi:hypothetical protein [Streptomyces sp. NPDC059564]|uniref:hypothetical protein n=1 Tax=Streptomyces sp. NPDC059564 TaxID=3346865 RepID=UPI00369F6E9D
MDGDADGIADEIADALYVPHPAGFTAARGAAAARAKAAGDVATAKRIAGLRRPTLAAWASNTLVRAQPEEVEQFLQLGQALREAHRSLDGEQLRDLSHQQHVVIGALAREAQRLAEEAGTPVSETVVREVERILYAVLADPDAARAWSSARLARPPTPAPAFPLADPSAIRDRRPAAAGPAPDAPAPTAPTRDEVPDPDAEAAREAGRVASVREEELREADEARQRAVARAAEADAEVTRLDADAERARAERDLAYEAVTQAETRHREAAAAAREARRAVTTAERRPGPR